MNRRMVKAKAARKWHAARRRWWERNPPTITITFHFDASALKAALFGMSQAADEAAAAMRGFGDAVARSQAIDSTCTRLEPGQLFVRKPGGELEHVGQTGPLLLEHRAPWCPLLCECDGVGPTCGYCRGHGAP